MVALGLMLVAGAAAYLWLPGTRRQDQGWGMRGWLWLAGAGLAITALGWAMFIPADPYYTPSVYGFTNRVNGLAGFGLIVFVYACLGMVGSLVGAVLLGRRYVPALVTVTLAAGLGATYVHVLERHGHIWDAAFRAEKDATARIKAAFPDLPRGTTIFVSDYPAYQTLGVPIFAVAWDLDGRLKLLYGDNSIRAYPITSEMGLSCGKRGFRPQGVDATGEKVAIVRYGTARFLDLSTGNWTMPHDWRQCLAAKERFQPGPLYLTTAY
jgi:hypothetical protein